MRALSSDARTGPQVEGASNERLEQRIDPIGTKARVRRIGHSLLEVREGDCS